MCCPRAGGGRRAVAWPISATHSVTRCNSLSVIGHLRRRISLILLRSVSANVAVDLFNKRGGVVGRPVVILEADDASDPETAVKAATTFIKEDRVDFLMGTFNGDCALAVSALAQPENKLFMVTGAHLPELTGAACNSHTF